MATLSVQELRPRQQYEYLPVSNSIRVQEQCCSCLPSWAMVEVNVTPADSTARLSLKFPSRVGVAPSLISDSPSPRFVPMGRRRIQCLRDYEEHIQAAIQGVTEKQYKSYEEAAQDLKVNHKDPQ
ncbi:hypothetical protein H2248_008345 [Termitomyces sp. 'cryptogamus']|nr:hypothetical protein H2248_008345 [Termitomyces sp. 'cryptogamus']